MSTSGQTSLDKFGFVSFLVTDVLVQLMFTLKSCGFSSHSSWNRICFSLTWMKGGFVYVFPEMDGSFAVLFVGKTHCLSKGTPQCQPPQGIRPY